MLADFPYKIGASGMILDILFNYKPLKLYSIE